MLFDNVVKSFLVLGALSLSASLSGCGGSGGGSGGTTPTPTPTPTPGPASTPTPPPTPVTGGTSYLFYSGSISAVDPAAPASPITVEAGTDTVADSETTFLAGTYDAATKTFNNVHAHAIVYAKADGKLYKASALRSSGTPTPVQLSSETAAGKCNYYIDYSDLANPDNSPIVYRTPGVNGTCGDSDDVFKMVRLGMNATDAPVMAKEPVESLLDATTGALTGWLVNDAGALKRCDANFANCSASLKSIIGDASNASSTRFSRVEPNRLLLNIDGALYVYDSDANTLSTAIGTLSVLGFTVVNVGPKLYFLTPNAPKSIYVAPVDGSASATVLVTDAADIRSLRLTADKQKLLYVTATETKTVAKTGGAAATLITSNDDTFLVSGNHVYYTLHNGTVPTAGVVDDDGSNKSETPNAVWAFGDFGTSLNLSDSGMFPIQTIIRVEGYNTLGAGKGFAGGTLRSFNAASKVEVGVLGTVPTDITNIGCVAFGANMLCDGSNSTQTDVFFLNAETPGSLVRVTNTPTKSESRI